MSDPCLTGDATTSIDKEQQIDAAVKATVRAALTVAAHALHACAEPSGQTIK